MDSCNDETDSCLVIQAGIYDDFVGQALEKDVLLSTLDKHRSKGTDNPGTDLFNITQVILYRHHSFGKGSETSSKPDELSLLHIYVGSDE